MPAPGEGCDGSLAARVRALWTEQCREWPMLARGATALEAVHTREMTVLGRRLVLQWNPARIISTGAKIDAAAIARRPCFLCGANRPAEQRGIAFGAGWQILCNPAPILAPHFTVAHEQHVPQRFAAALDAMLDLSGALGGEFTVLYNGPTAGASAPDHLHLQAVPFGRMPLDALVCEPSARRDGFVPLPADGVWLGASRGDGWPVIAAVGSERAALQAILARVTAAIGAIRATQPEAALNAYARGQGSEWVIWLVPRAAHRPVCYGEGAGQFLVSPGAIDVGGMVITPRREDFDRLTPDVVAGILRGVCLPEDEWRALPERLSASASRSGGSG